MSPGVIEGEDISGSRMCSPCRFPGLSEWHLGTHSVQRWRQGQRRILSCDHVCVEIPVVLVSCCPIGVALYPAGQSGPRSWSGSAAGAWQHRCLGKACPRPLARTVVRSPLITPQAWRTTTRPASPGIQPSAGACNNWSSAIKVAFVLPVFNRFSDSCHPHIGARMPAMPAPAPVSHLVALQ